MSDHHLYATADRLRMTLVGRIADIDAPPLGVLWITDHTQPDNHPCDFADCTARSGIQWHFVAADSHDPDIEPRIAYVNLCVHHFIVHLHEALSVPGSMGTPDGPYTPQTP